MFNALRAENSPFNAEQAEQLRNSLRGLDATQSAWLSGYLAGCLAQSAGADTQASANLPALSAHRGAPLGVFYASQTGNGEALARALAGQLADIGVQAQLRSMTALRPAALKQLQHAVFVISTHGEGDPPDDALELFEYLQGPRAARLESLHFSVLALGDQSYQHFCAAGRRLETLLLAQGASAVIPRVECDLDYQAAATSWSQAVTSYGQQTLLGEPEPTHPAALAAATARLSVVPRTVRWTRSNPFQATVEQVRKITGLESEKDVFHIELSLADSGISYQPGDSLGIWGHNDPKLVEQVLIGLGLSGSEPLELDGHHHTAHEFLARHRELTRLSPDAVARYASLAGNDRLKQQFAALDANQQRAFIEQRQFIDLLEEFPPANGAVSDAQALVQAIRPLAPRSYSIASSQDLVGDEAHLTVATRFSAALGKQRRGVTSNHLNHRLQPGEPVNVYLETNQRFRLPENRDTPLVLIAAGTGVAPYRAFLQQLQHDNANPDTWLIFGNPHLRTDFLYQREWLAWRKQGLLTRIDGAFSRDQAEKRYVQHLVVQQAQEIGRWLEREACVYICGSLSMGQQVEQALTQIFVQQGLQDGQAVQRLADLRRQGRLLKDLY